VPNRAAYLLRRAKIFGVDSSAQNASGEVLSAPN